jgi:hypothetical protein
VIGTLTWDIRAADKTLEVTAGNISIDDQNIPAIAASVMVPYDADVLAALDPRLTPPPRVVLTGTYVGWASKTLAQLDEYLEGADVETIADLSALWDGLTLADITDQFATPLTTDSPAEPHRMSLDLHVREVSHDTFTMTVSLASDEALLADWAIVSPFDIVALQDAREGYSTSRASTYIDSVLQVVLGRRTVTNAYTARPVVDYAVDVLALSNGPTGWEIVREVLDDADLKLRVDRDGRNFLLLPPEEQINQPGTWVFLDGDTPLEDGFVPTDAPILELRQVYTRTDGWYDSAILRGTDGSVAGSGKSVHSRTYVEDLRAGIKATSSMANSVVIRTRNRGRFIDLVLPIRLGVFMRDHFLYASLNGQAGQEWAVKSVNYDLTTNTMRIRGEQPY